MYKSISTFLFLSLLILVQGCTMLENPEPRERKIEEAYLKYASFPAAKKEVLLREDFINNTRNWRVIPSFQYSILIQNGLLVMRSDYPGSERSTITVNTFTGRDNFELETYIKEDFTNHTKIRNRFIWGFNASTNQYRFIEIDDDNGEFYIGTSGGGNSTINYYPTPNGPVTYNRGGFNKYTIRKIDNMYYYFLNETCLFTEPFSSFSGYEIGFQVGNYNAMRIDYLTISKLNK